MKILVLDNYDSFTYNLVQLLTENSKATVEVFRNDKISLDKVAEYDKIMLSPGPGLPQESGILMQLIEKYAPSKSIFGVCLGLQAIASVYGGKLYNLPHVVHGVATPVNIIRNSYILAGLSPTFIAGRYHSWVADVDTLPDCLEITAEDANHQIMAIQHKTHDLCAVQFHPESILTPEGEMIIQNWLKTGKTKITKNSTSTQHSK
ncbi:MAG: aminodeoxychorismate/anthranilate synthase component II [Bacteroidetes bacterium]|nr:aminodeoxychorismate/anthranilate synthase component II [Bacteroidota bacterium]MBU1580249.1 aminodeoxychorismate/anthranilate synthase component II [Bacteroidota bacterium]MBU2465385.1 aminodeoxychorismate/anthranilate synthase component II [Bacteroidota bacterium]MBU2557992.1 aminodeoxychorismate/anthranilate synthase component II [Bacteroidota bacterium]